jgi:outer membrane protein assembly factor BamA
VLAALTLAVLLSPTDVRLKPDATSVWNATVASGFRRTEQSPSNEVIAEIRIHGNVLTPDAEVRRLAGIDIGSAFTAETPALALERLKASRRFKRVEVLKRFASIADPTQIVVVVVVDEGPVKIEVFEDAGKPAQVVRRSGFGLMFLPLLDFEDGYGFTYGVQLARPGVAGAHSRLSFPLTWGGDKRAAIQLDKTFEPGSRGMRGLLTRVETGASISRRTNPFFDLEDDRRRIWLRAERAFGGSIIAGGTASWQHVSFGGESDRFTQVGADITFDTRLDPMLARNAVYARASFDHLGLDDTAGDGVNRAALEARGYVGLPGQTILVVRAVREAADAALPGYLQPLLGGMSNLRGFRAGIDAGDTLVAGSLEIRAPLTSPLSVGKFGVNAFVDAGAVYGSGQRLGDQPLRRGVGAGVWFSAAFLRLNIAVAHGIGATTRAHFGAGVSF